MSVGLPGIEGQFSTILADPPWRFRNRTGKVAPELGDHRKLDKSLNHPVPSALTTALIIQFHLH